MTRPPPISPLFPYPPLSGSGARAPADLVARLQRRLGPQVAARHVAHALGQQQQRPGQLVAQHDGQHHGAEDGRSEEHTSELQSPCNLVCRLLLEKKKKKQSKLYSVCTLVYVNETYIVSSA